MGKNFEKSLTDNPDLYDSMDCRPGGGKSRIQFKQSPEVAALLAKRKKSLIKKIPKA